MLSPRWMKLARDVALTPGRVAMMVLAIASGVFGLATMLSSYTILSREIRQNYLETNPASATLRVDHVDAKLIAGIRSFPGIAAAQASSTIGARIESGAGNWQPLSVLALDDFSQMQINTIYPEKGAWPPAPGTILLERESLKMLKAEIGESLHIKTADGVSHHLTISGTTHDPGTPVPSLTVFGYATPATLQGIGVDANLRDLKITVKDQAFDIDAIERTASALALWIQQQGHKLDLIRIPPPGEHPHQLIMTSILAMLLLFSLIALILSAVLSANNINGLLAQQIRQIGVMKTIGAKTSQVATLYLSFVVIVGVLATCIGLPAGLAAGRAFAETVLVNILNFSLHSGAVPAYVYLVLLGTGVLIPLVLASMPIAYASSISVQTALIDFGATRQEYAVPRLLRCFDRFPGVDRSLLMALRNSFRRRGRLLLMLGLLATAGAMFMSSLNVRRASEQHLIDAAADRHYELELVLSAPAEKQKIERIIQGVAGVDLVEAWSGAAVARQRPDGLEIERTYPDGAHGSMNLLAVPEHSQMISLSMLSGVWLDTQEIDTVVLNHKAVDSFPQVKVGDSIRLSAHGQVAQLRVVGIARQLMSAATAYVSGATYEKMLGQGGLARNYRVRMKDRSSAAIDAVTKQIELALGQQNISTSLSITENLLRQDADAHFNLLIMALMFISLLMALVGVLGLGSSMSNNVAERTREFGIMRSIGASSGVLLRNVMVEALFIALLSWLIALVMAVPLSSGIGAFLGNLLFNEPFPLVWSQKTAWIWLLLVSSCALAASVYPALRAARLSIREAFAFN